MRCKSIFHLAFLFLLPTLIFSQEICNNGIDDDGDGLVDLNDDTECICDGDLPGSFYVVNQICTAAPIFSLATDYQNGLAYQWYRDGVALVGETDLIYLASPPFIEGEYVLNVSTANNCLSSVPYEFINSAISMNITDTICIEETYLFNGNELTTPGTYFAQFEASNGCDSTVHLTLELHDCGDTIRNLSDQFRLQLIEAGVDQNGDSRIQYTEAENIDSLDVSYENGTPSWQYQITDIRGIEYFTNLVYLNCANNRIYSLDVDTLSKLKHLNCYSNNMSNLSLLELQDLEYLDLGGNNFSNPIDLSNNSNLKYFINHFNREDELDFSNNPKLLEIDLYRDLSIDTLILKGLHQLEYFRITSGGNMHSIDFSDATNLKKIVLRQLELEEPIDFTPLKELEELTYTLSSLETIDLTNASKLEYVDFSSNLLTSFDGSPHPNLYYANLYDNLNLTSVNFNDNPELITLNVQRCGLDDHILDLSYNGKLDTLLSYDVKELWIKNGSIESELDIWFDVWIDYVCCDEEQYEEVRALINQSVPVSFECSLVSTNELESSSVLIRPNLVTHTLTVQSQSQIKSIYLINAEGNKAQELFSVQASELELSVDNLVPGIYFLQIHTEEGMVVKKFIKL